MSQLKLIQFHPTDEGSEKRKIYSSIRFANYCRSVAWEFMNKFRAVQEKKGGLS